MTALKNLLKDQTGMTGLETAIILIAFVTVAAVFGYAILSAGLFSAERGKETVYAGLNEARSNLELSGSVIAEADNATPTQVGQIKFTVKNAIAGNPIDMTPNGVDPRSVDQTGKNKCVISLLTQNSYFNNVAWTYVPVGDDNGNNLLETGEQFEITVDISHVSLIISDSGRILSLGALVCGPSLRDLLLSGNNGPAGLSIQANDTFSIQVKPALGSTITIRRQLPPAITPVMDLH
jgi:flagellin FlaB